MKRKQNPTDAALKELREFGLRYPGAHLKSPWPGHLDLAVKDKTFAYLSVEGDPFSISCKLPESNALALLLPFCTPTEYGLGKSGWVSAKIPDARVPLDMFKSWIDESYRAQAPKKLVAALAATAPDSPAVPAKVKAKAKAKAGAKPKRAARAAPKRAAPSAKKAAARPSAKRGAKRRTKPTARA